MTRPAVLLIWLFFAGFTASCSVKVESFALRGAAGENVCLYLDSSGDWKEPGELFLSAGGETVFYFEKPLDLEDGLALHLGFKNAAEGLALYAMQGEKGALTAAARAPLFAAAEGGLCLWLPRGTYSAFSIAHTGQDSAARERTPALRIVDAAIVPYEPVFRLEPSGEIYASSAILPEPGASPGECRVRLAQVSGNAEYSLRVTLKSPNPSTPRIGLRNEKKTFTVSAKTRPVPEDLWFHSRFLGFTPGEAVITGLAPGSGLEIFLEENPEWSAASSSFAPVPADLASVLGAFFPDSRNPARRVPPAWRHPDFEVFRWSLFPGVLVFDSRDYTVQKRLFHRLAFFIEKTGFRGMLQPDSRIWSRHGWNAHNYNAEGLARFFETARTENFPLNREERWLAEYLVSQGVLRKEKEAFLPGRGGILGISRESSPATRSLLLTHEAFHGVYYEIAGYRDLVEKTWQDLPLDQKEFWRIYFTWMDYDIADHYLLVNEFQAYLLQQPLSLIDTHYKITITQRLSAGNEKRGARIAALLEKYPDMFSRPARILSGYLEKTAGIRAGDVESLRQEPDTIVPVDIVP
jgi:hypothetical protein